MKKTNACAMIPGVSFLAFLSIAGSGMAVELQPIEELGKHIFFDNISVPQRMSCSTCHDPAAGWTFKNSGTNLHQVAITGADPHTAGSLKPPSNAYASFIPEFQTCRAFPTLLCGGNFWNGRSEGNDPALFPGGAAPHITLSDIGGNVAYETYLGPVADQALNPFGNPVEQNIERKEVCQHVESAKYAELYEDVWGEPINCSDVNQDNSSDVNQDKPVDKSFKRIAVSLAAYQSSAEVNSFSSKRDIALANDNDDTPGKFPLEGLTPQENLGHDLFYGKGRCTICHRSDALDGTGQFERYTDDSYHNIGTPRNYELPGSPEPNDNDGLAGHTGLIGQPDPDIQDPPLPPLPDHRGEFKTPTLRNVDKRPDADFIKAYTHNGWFKSLESIVHFYNTAFITETGSAPNGSDTTAKTFGIKRCDPTITTEQEALAQNCWPAPEHPDTAAIGFVIGNLGLSAEEEAAIVAYLKTFTDTETPRQPQPFKPAKK